MDQSSPSLFLDHRCHHSSPPAPAAMVAPPFPNEEQPFLRIIRSSRRLGHFHPNSPNPHLGFPLRSLHDSHLHCLLQHHHRPTLRNAHACPTHEIHSCRRRLRNPTSYHFPNRHRRCIYCHRPPPPRGYRSDVDPFTVFFLSLLSAGSNSLKASPLPSRPSTLSSLLFLIIFTGSGDHNDRHDLDDDQPRRRNSKRLRIMGSIPAALIVFLLGLVLCFIRDPSIFGDLKFGPSKIGLLSITWNDWKVGFLKGAVPQIPLSVLNSVIAVCKLSGDLFPDRTELSAAKVSASVGAMNLVGCWFGAMPVCHGAGGLAGQYRFGARSGWSVVFLGIGKLVIGLVFGNSFVRILNQFPIGILGVLLLFAGIELAMASRDMNSKEESFVMLVCAAVSMTGSSAALGFVCGILLFLLLKLRKMEFSGSGLSKFKFGSAIDAETSSIP
ncbi:hypothetical protein V6N13_023911 [Hibiscus sabdariffa]|uniref:Sulfate transporter n=1 Tax=Hibiscus sabdariffa TaxID=183260 RepID=A0ABR2PNV2_9ROSI